MEMTIGEMLFYVEMHTGTVRNINQLTRWFEKYKNCEETVLWVCLDGRQVKICRVWPVEARHCSPLWMRCVRTLGDRSGWTVLARNTRWGVWKKGRDK